MNNKFNYIYLLTFILCCGFGRPVNAGFIDWLWPDSKNTNSFIRSEGPIIPIPFEYKTEDEKFLEEASKYTDLIKTSSLDVCQYKVILKIKTSCFSMTEEELAKMSVNLLNCQSEVDGRKVFPCTESMSLKECTEDMDANMWNAYHLMNNRARAVCLAARRAQFHALSEMTINKLMSTAHDQINKMTTLLNGQEKLETLTLGTLDSMEKGNMKLMEQQENLKVAQKTVQDFVKFNLEQLTQEKALIAAGNEELALMTKSIKEKLDDANQQLIFQSKNRSENHKKLMNDVEALQKQAHYIFQKIDSSTEELLAQHEVAYSRYEEAVENLVKINDTVHYLLKIINTTRNEIDEKLFWITDFLNGTGTSIERLSSITFHIAYLLIGMLFASFLNASSASRALLAAIVPLNLFVTYNHGSEMGLNFSQMTILLSSTILAVAVIHKCQKLFFPKPTNYEYLTANNLKSSPGFESNKSKHEKSKSLNVINYVVQNFRNAFNKFSFNLNQFLSFIFGYIVKNSSQSYQLASSRNEENLISSSFREERNQSENSYGDYTPLRDRYEQSVHSRVNEWLHSKVYYEPRQSSECSSKSGSSKYYCSAICRSGRRCKNVSSPGRDFCYKHTTGTSIAS